MEEEQKLVLKNFIFEKNCVNMLVGDDMNEVTQTALEQNHNQVLENFEQAIRKNSNLKIYEDAIAEIMDEMLYNSVMQEIDIDFTTLISRIETLTFKEGNRFILHEAYRYDVNKNEVELKKEEIKENDEYLLTAILYDVALHPKKQEVSYFSSLYTGEIHDFASSLKGSENIPFSNLDEVMLYRSLKAVLGQEVIYKGLQTSDCKDIYESMQENGFTMEDIKNICDTSNYNQQGRQNLGASTLLDTQKRIIDVFTENALKNPTFAHQQMHFLKKSLTFPFEVQSDMKYTLKGIDEVKQVVGKQTLPTAVLLEYLEQKSTSLGFNELEVEAEKKFS